MLNTQTRYTIPVVNAYPGEAWRIVRQNHRDVTLKNVEGYMVTVSPMCLEAL